MERVGGPLAWYLVGVDTTTQRQTAAAAAAASSSALCPPMCALAFPWFRGLRFNLQICGLSCLAVFWLACIWRRVW